ncbi:unnamed protein product [Tuber aestivum]|uniref:Uncharacterized protein n=1 Tax=Tuber aestivum TaxID=59557 RepID=A0A292PKZ0_9PEZI|nr:unnamed protein product [Tuber aestivum]
MTQYCTVLRSGFSQVQRQLLTDINLLQAYFSPVALNRHGRCWYDLWGIHFILQRHCSAHRSIPIPVREGSSTVPPYACLGDRICTTGPLEYRMLPDIAPFGTVAQQDPKAKAR